ncbi:hypothetical protein ACHAWF_000139, partial [Thalassiosira exigua]
MAKNQESRERFADFILATRPTPAPPTTPNPTTSSSGTSASASRHWGRRTASSMDSPPPFPANIVNKRSELTSVRHEMTATQYAYNAKVVNGIEAGGMVSYDDE